MVGNVLGTIDDAGELSKIDMEAFGKVHEGGQTGIRLTTKEDDPASELITSTRGGMTKRRDGGCRRIL